jgi:hypothetical protein
MGCIPLGGRLPIYRRSPVLFFIWAPLIPNSLLVLCSMQMQQISELKTRLRVCKHYVQTRCQALAKKHWVKGQWVDRRKNCALLPRPLPTAYCKFHIFLRVCFVCMRRGEKHAVLLLSLLQHKLEVAAAGWIFFGVWWNATRWAANNFYQFS